MTRARTRRARARSGQQAGGSLGWLALALLVTALGTWEVAARVDAVSRLLFPAPTVTLRTLAGLVADGRLLVDTGATLGRVAGGLGVGASTGFVVGLLIGWRPRLRSLFDPLIAVFHPIPKIALLPVFLLIFGIGEPAILALVSVTAFFPMAITTMTGVMQINPTYYTVAASYRAGPWMTLRRVVLPASLPVALAGLRLSLNTTLVVTIAVELLSAPRGLGATIWFAWETLRTDELYATLLVVAMLGVLFNHLLRWLERRVAPWHQL